jgi:hypothetical protein
VTEEIKKVSRYAELGVASDFDPSWGIRQDDFLTDLRGERGIQRLREMSSNDAIIGAILSAMDLMLRAVPVRIEGGSAQARELVDYCLHNMQDQTFEMFLSDVLSFLPYGFSVFEIVARPPSQNPNGWVTLKKLAPRAQWTIDHFQTDKNGDIQGVWQFATTRSSYIPYSKLLHFRTASRQNDPAGLSVLRNAYLSWYFARRIQEIEAVAIERELNGLPLVRIPSEYMAADATDAQRAFVNQISAIARDVKKNEQGFVILPSDVYEDADGKLTDIRLVDFELIASQGKRDIDTHQVVLRYQMDMARSALADFVMLGVNDRGSFALSKSKADLFLQALTGYVSAIASVLNRKLVPKLLGWNGIPMADAPKIVFGRVAPIDLAELGNYIQRVGGIGIDLTDEDSQIFLRDAAGIPGTAQPPAPRPQPGAAPTPTPTPTPDEEDEE